MRQRALLGEKALSLARDCYAAHLAARPNVRRLFNQAFFKKLFVVNEDNIRSDLASPVDVLLSDELRAGAAALAKAEPAIARQLNDPLKERVLESLSRTWNELVQV